MNNIHTKLDLFWFIIYLFHIMFVSVWLDDISDIFDIFNSCSIFFFVIFEFSMLL